MDNKSGKIRTETHSGVFVRGLRIPSRFSPCKTHSREMAQTSGFDPTTQVKMCFDCKMFDVANWVASLNGENGPGGMPSHAALSVSSQGALEISSVAGQPPSLDRIHCSPPRLVAKSLKRDERCRPSSQGPQSSTRTIYKSKWALFEKWFRENSVDFSTPSVKQISDFFMYLYQDLNRCPSTIDGYRTTIVDTLGPTAHHIAHNADLHRLLSSFHRDRPKSSRNLPK